MVVDHRGVEHRPGRQPGVRRRVGQPGVQAADRDRPVDDLPVAGRRVDRPGRADVRAEVEERHRLATRLGGRRRVVVDRRRDPTEQETGLVRPEVDVRPLAVRVGRGGLAVEAGQAPPGGDRRQLPLDRGEQMVTARRGHRHRLAGVADPVVGRPERHRRVAEQLAGARLGDARDHEALGDPAGHRVGVVDPSRVVRVAIGRADGVGQPTGLLGFEQADPRPVNDRLGHHLASLIRPPW